jgi:hypothetical protein
MDLIVPILIILAIGYGAQWLFFWLGERHRQYQAKNMRYLLIRIQNDVADSGKSTIQSMKQNIELMNQFLKNMMSLWQDDMRHKFF